MSIQKGVLKKQSERVAHNFPQYMSALKRMNQDKKYRRCFLLFSRQRRQRAGVLRARAFSIIEVLIATAVVAIGLTAVLQLLSSSLSNSFQDTDAIIAVELAQEGLEYAYNFRDNNLVNGLAPFTNFPGSAGRDFCGPDIASPTFVLAGVGRNCFANALSSEHRYSLNQVGDSYRFQNTVTHFARIVSINLDNIVTPTSAEVTSIVWWGQSDTLPAGVFPGVTADSIDVSQCTRVNQCAYVRAVLADWKP